MFKLPQLNKISQKEMIVSILVVSILVILTAWAVLNRPLRPELEEEIKKLHPSVQNRFRRFIREVERKTDWRVIIYSGYRGYAWSYQIWSTNPQVQACCPPCQDYHCFGLALDIGLVKGSQQLGNSSSRQSWENTGIRKIARKYKLQWGIDFNGYYDPVHFAWPRWPIDSLVAQAIKQYGSLQMAEGNRVKTIGLPKRDWKIA